MPGLRSDNHIQDSPEYQAISAHLGNGQPQDKAIDTFCEPIEDHFMKTQNPEDIEPLLWRAWQSITTIAAETPHESEQKRQKLSDLVIKIQARPVLESNGTTCNVWDAAVWKDLPVFGAQMREAYNSAATSRSSPAAQSAWLNLNAFTATLLAAGHKNTAFAELSLFGLWTIRTALEEQEEPDHVALDAAALWFVHASPALRALCQQSKTFDGKVAKPGFLFKEDSWRGFSMERWQTWEKRMRDVGSGDLVEKARSAMAG